MERPSSSRLRPRRRPRLRPLSPELEAADVAGGTVSGPARGGVLLVDLLLALDEPTSGDPSSILVAKDLVAAGGKVRMLLLCGDGPAAGRVRLTASGDRRRVVGPGRFTCDPPQSSVEIRLSRSGRRLVENRDGRRPRRVLRGASRTRRLLPF